MNPCSQLSRVTNETLQLEYSGMGVVCVCVLLIRHTSLVVQTKFLDKRKKPDVHVASLFDVLLYGTWAL